MYNMKKWIIPILMVLFGTVVLADEGEIEKYKPSEVFDLGVHVSNVSGDVLGADCRIQIRNSSYNTVVNTDMNEIGGGWYNFTYNTTTRGIHFCRHNCTQGPLFVSETCDFIIEGDDQVSLSAVFVTLFIISIYLIMLFILQSRMFAEHGGVKIALIVLILWMMLLPLNIVVEFNEFNVGPTTVTTQLELLYRIMIYINYAATFYLFFFVIMEIIKKLRGAASAKNK